MKVPLYNTYISRALILEAAYIAIIFFKEMSRLEEDLGGNLRTLKIGRRKTNYPNGYNHSSISLDENEDDLSNRLSLGLVVVHSTEFPGENDIAFGTKESNGSSLSILNSQNAGTAKLEANGFQDDRDHQPYLDIDNVYKNSANHNLIMTNNSNAFSQVSVNSEVPVTHLDSDSDSNSDSGGWQTMPAVASYNVYDQTGKLEVETYKYQNFTTSSQNMLNSQGTESPSDKKKTAAFSYTKVGAEEQAQRTYQSNKKIDFLFDHKRLMKVNNSKTSVASSSVSDIESEFYDEYEEEIEPMNDLNANKQLSLTRRLLDDNEKIAYVGAINVITNQMCEDLARLSLCVDIKSHKKLARRIQYSQREIAAWKTDILSRLYKHLDINHDEIVMVEKLALHGVELEDLCKCLKTTQTIENPFEHELSDSGDEEAGIDSSIIKEDIEERENRYNTIDTTTNNEENEFTKDETKDENGLDDTYDITLTKPIERKMSTTSTVPNRILEPGNIKDKERLDIDVAWTIVCDLFLLFLQNSTYDSRSRTLLIKFADVLNITKMEINEFEKRVTDSLDLEQSTEDQIWNESQLMTRRRKKNKKKKMVYVGLAMVGGSLVLGLSGGLLAPVIGAGIAAGLSTIGVTGAAGFLTGVGGTATVAVTSTAWGAKIGAQGMSKRMGSVRTFEFRPLHNNRRLNLMLSVSGWMIGNEDDVRLPFSTVDPIEGDLFSLLWEPDMLKSTGQTIGIVASEVFTQTVQQVLGATILTAFMASIQWPMALSKLGYIIDNPWNVSLDRAWSAGLILADTLISRNLGQRPITLVGFSLGSRVIYSCLIELSKRKAMGLVENVFIFGTPTVRNKEQLVMARSVVSGRFVNGYSDKDWVLAYLFRATSGGFSAVMGISPVPDIEGIQNFDCTAIVEGHMYYRKNMPTLLKEMGVAVTSEEFVEIEETIDPEEVTRQRQLLHDVDAAQKKLAAQKKSNSWVPKWMKSKNSKWQDMLEESVGEGPNTSDSTNSTASYPKKNNNPLVNHSALVKELANIKATMQAEDEKNGVEPSAKKVLDLMELTKPELQTYLKPPSSPNNFSLLSAGRPILPKDDDSQNNGRHVSYTFPDDI